MPIEFKLPELGENVEKGDVVRVLVASGDTISVDQPVLELETDKATIEVPSSVAGKVSDVKVKAGDKVKVGQVVLVVESAGAAATPAPAAKADAATDKTDKTDKTGKTDKVEDRARAATAGDAHEAEEAEAPAPSSQAKPASKPAPVVDISSGRQAVAPKTDNPAPIRSEPGAAASLELAPSVPAAPSVRRFARELGVDIARVPGTGPGGRIGQDDVKQHVKSSLAGSS